MRKKGSQDKEAVEFFFPPLFFLVHIFSPALHWAGEMPQLVDATHASGQGVAAPTWINESLSGSEILKDFIKKSNAALFAIQFLHRHVNSSKRTEFSLGLTPTK